MADTSDNDQMRTFTSRKLDWINGISIDPEMTSHDLHVAFEIARCLSAQTGHAIIADDTIAKATKTTRGYVLKARKRLQARGWLDWRPTRTANLYFCKDGMVDAMIDLRTDLRNQRDEARFERLPSRRIATKQEAFDHNAVDPSVQPDDVTVHRSEQLTVDPSAHHAVDPSAHTHPQCSTEIVHQEDLLPIREVFKEEVLATEPKRAVDDKPLAAITHPQLAEMELFYELGDGDPDRGVRIAAAIGDQRYDALHSALMGGRLRRSTIQAASRGIREVAA